MDNNLWTRRTNNSKLSLSTPSNGANGSAPQGDSSTRNASFSKRFGGDTSSHGKSNPFNSATTPGGGLASPGSASNAFGLGSGAFAAFSQGSAKTPKTAGNPFDLALGSAVKSHSSDKFSKETAAGGKQVTAKPPSVGSISEQPPGQRTTKHVIRYKWIFWSRPPVSRQSFANYGETLNAMCFCVSVEDFWLVYRHLLYPSQLAVGWEYHFFKDGIRPIWEDEENKNGGKWVIRLRKGVADRYWESLLIGLVGDQFDESEEVCGAVISVRKDEDILSLWTRSSSGKVLKIRENMKSILECPSNTRVEFKSHDTSIQQRSTLPDRRAAAQQHHRQPESSETADEQGRGSPPSL